MRFFSCSLLGCAQRILYYLDLLERQSTDGAQFTIKREKDSKTTFNLEIQYLPDTEKK